VTAAGLPALRVSSDQGGELVQSLVYREAYVPATPTLYDSPVRHRLIDQAPGVLRSAAGGAWALVSLAVAGAVLVVLVLVLVRVAGVLA
jgi:hypothetical protein